MGWPIFTELVLFLPLGIKRAAVAAGLCLCLKKKKKGCLGRVKEHKPAAKNPEEM